MAHYETILDATRAWVTEMKAFPHSMIEKLMSIDIDSWREITPPSLNDRVYVFDSGDYGNIIDITDTEDEEIIYTIEFDNGKTVKIEVDDFEKDSDSLLPMWGTLWQFSNGCDDYWLEDLDGLQKMADCGFRIYEHDEWGYFFGIDGCGYCFYDAHWIPLYKARGLKWHNQDEKQVEN